MEGRDKEQKSISPSNRVILASEVGENDVLLGRGAGPNTNRGNIIYRKIVQEVLSRASNEDNPKPLGQKNRMAREIVDTVHSRNGRFLRKLTMEEVIRGTGATHGRMGPLPSFYVVAPDHIAMEKSRQAMRSQKALKRASAASESKKLAKKTFHRSPESKGGSAKEANWKIGAEESDRSTYEKRHRSDSLVQSKKKAAPENDSATIQMNSSIKANKERTISSKKTAPTNEAPESIRTRSISSKHSSSSHNDSIVSATLWCHSFNLPALTKIVFLYFPSLLVLQQDMILTNNCRLFLMTTLTLQVANRKKAGKLEVQRRTT